MINPRSKRHIPRASDYEAFVCDNPRCGARLAVPPDANMTVLQWRDSPEVVKWIAEHREHAGCAGISLMPNARRRVEQLDPDQIALSLVEDLSVIDDSEYWQTQPAARRKAAKQVQLSKIIAELKAYLVGPKI